MPQAPKQEVHRSERLKILAGLARMISRDEELVEQPLPSDPFRSPTQSERTDQLCGDGDTSSRYGASERAEQVRVPERLR